MITNVSMNSFKPTFGFAKLSDKGAEAARAFGFPENEFLDAALFCKPKGISSKKTALGQTLSSGFTLEQIVDSYGCTDNPKANAEFIKNNILSNKGKKIIKKINVSDADKQVALLKLWDKNYDNPELCVKDTKALLELIKEYIAPANYAQNQGFLIDAK